MSKGLTKKQKIEGYDKVAAERDVLTLAVHDLVNHKFGIAVTRLLRDYDPSESVKHDRITVAMSWRAMPLFLIRYIHSANDDTVRVMTEEEIQDTYKQYQTSAWARAIESARAELIAKQLRKDQEKGQVTRV